MSDLHQQRAVELARRNAQHYTFRYRSMVLHWLGRAFRRPAPVELAPLPVVDPGQVAVTWGGHATVLVRYHRLVVLCDPVLARSVHGVRRERTPGLTADALTDVDLVLISHVAADHLDLAALSRLSRVATVVVPPRAGARVSPLGFARLVELSPGTSLQHRDLLVTAEAVRHGDRGSPAQSYVIRGDGPTVYFCGASGYFPGFADVGRRHWPDVALLPIGGYSPRSFRARHMSPLDALYAFEDLRARVMVPIRYGTFALSYERMNDPDRWLAELVSERHLDRFVVRLAHGESRVFVPPGPMAAYQTGRFEIGADSGAPTPPAQVAAEVRRVVTRQFALRHGYLPLAAPEAPPGTASVVRPLASLEPPGPPPPARRQPALIVDHEDETGVFDRTSEPRVQGGAASAVEDAGDEGAGLGKAGADGAGEEVDDLDLEESATVAIALDAPAPGSAAAAPVRGSR